MANQKPSRLTFEFWEALPNESVQRMFWGFAALLFGLRLLVLAVLPIDLSGDEAYYWEWGRHLDWGYVSKPPGIAWLMALASKVGGNSTFGLRMFAVALGTGSLIFVFRLAWRLYGAGVAMVTAFVFVANPANAALNLILTIDAPLMFFWSLSIWSFWEFIQAGRESDAGTQPTGAWRRARLKWGLVLLLSLSGGFLSKQIMLAFLPLAVLFLALSRDHRAQLARPGLWLLLGGSLVGLLPTLGWNLQNDWLTVRNTTHHFESSSVSVGRQVVRFLEYVGSQGGIFTPVLYALAMGLLLAVPRCWRRLQDRERFLWVFSGPALLVILLMALRLRIQPNWPAVFYAPAGVLLVGWAAGKWSAGWTLDRWRWAFSPGLKVAAVIVAGVYGGAFALSLGLVRLPGFDPTARLRGWSQFASEVDAVRRELAGGRDMKVITQGHRSMTSELAFYLPDHPHIYPYNPEPGTIQSQHDLWETPAARIGEDFLIVVHGSPQSVRQDLESRFESFAVHSVLSSPDRFSALHVVTLAVGRNLLRWPSSRQ